MAMRSGTRPFYAASRRRFANPAETAANMALPACLKRPEALLTEARDGFPRCRAWPQQQLADQVLRRRLEIPVGKIRRHQRRCDVKPEERTVVQRDRRPDDRKTHDRYQLNRKVQQVTRIRHVAGGFDDVLKPGRHDAVSY